MTVREAAQQALEALEMARMNGEAGLHKYETLQIAESAEALRAALAEPVQEPVAWMHTDAYNPKNRYLEWSENRRGYLGDWIKTPLYTAPPQRKPLTEEEIRQMFFSELRALPSYPSAIEELPERLARAIETAHGIE